MAERLVLHLFKQDKTILADFGDLITKLKTDLKYCSRCGNISEDNLCLICKDHSRVKNLICVVEEPLDIIAIERTKKYHGLYHVLGGTLGLGKKSNENFLKIAELENRIPEEKIKEIILAFNPTTEGDATAIYLKKTLQKYPVKITRLARGLSTGGDIEYADEITLSEALTNRK